jgi:hypothetical protein
LQDAAGVVQLAADAVLVIGPSGGGGGGATVDPTQLIQTGNMIFRYGVGVLAGYVRLNGLTIGSATSAATERANADCQACFNYLWGIDPNLIVSGGRGASAAADWAANKQLAVPDWRGYAVGALDDMGNTPAGRLSSTYWGGAPTTLGAVGGGESTALVVGQLPVFVPSGNIVNGAISVTATWNNLPSGALRIGNGDIAVVQQGSTAVVGQPGTLGFQVSQGASAFQGAAIGGGQPHRTIGPRKLVTFYIKL